MNIYLVRWKRVLIYLGGKATNYTVKSKMSINKGKDSYNWLQLSNSKGSNGYDRKKVQYKQL